MVFADSKCSSAIVEKKHGKLKRQVLIILSVTII